MEKAMKVLAACAAVMFACVCANVAFGSPWEIVQAFEWGSQPPTWSQESYKGDGKWEFDKKGDDLESTDCHSGKFNARITVGEGNTTRLISPVMDLSGYTKARLRFYFLNREKDFKVDVLSIVYRTSPEAAWNKLTEQINTKHETWTCKDIEFEKDLSGTYQIAFVHIGKNGHGVAIDDVEVGPCVEEWTDSNSIKWTYYVGKDGRAKIYNGMEAPAIDKSKAGSITVPSKVNGKDADIDEYAFFGCDKLTSVTIEDGVTSIGERAFRGCTGLANVTIPGSVTSIGQWVFENTPFYSSRPDGLLVFGSVAYRMKGTCPAEVSIPDGVVRIESRAFYECATLEEVTIPCTVTSIGSSAFSYCTALKEVMVSEGVASIEDHAFYGCGALTSMVIPGSVANIGEYAFYDCAALAEVTILDGVASIGALVFGACPNLTSVTIPKSVTSIGSNAFSSCDKLEKVYVAEGDADRVRGLVAGSGCDVSKVEFVEPKDEAVTWFTTRAEAFAEARRTGKTVFMICGRDTCGNTMMTKNVSCEDPKVKGKLTAKCVLWYSNCDTQQDDNLRYWKGMGEVPLPIVCAIDPNDPEHYILRIAGPQTADGILNLLQWIPEPSGSPVVDPETIDPTNPGDLPWYKVINASDIRDPIRTTKAETLRGAAYYGGEVVGIVELKVGKLSKNSTTKVSGSVTLFATGKKHTIKSTQVYVGTMASSVSLDVKGLGGMSFALGSIGGVDVFAGALGRWHVQIANVGGAWNKADATVEVAVGDVSAFGGGVFTELLPTNEVAAVANGKWKFAKAATVKYAKPKSDQPTYTLPDATGKALVIDTSKDKTNLSGLKLTYTPKTGMFKGSFKVYALQSGKLKKFTVNATGAVVDGVGYGIARCKKPAVAWSVTVK